MCVCLSKQVGRKLSPLSIEAIELSQTLLYGPDLNPPPSKCLFCRCCLICAHSHTHIHTHTHTHTRTHTHTYTHAQALDAHPEAYCEFKKLLTLLLYARMPEAAQPPGMHVCMCILPPWMCVYMYVRGSLGCMCTAFSQGFSKNTDE